MHYHRLNLQFQHPIVKMGIKECLTEATGALSQVKPGLYKIFYQGSVFSNDLSPSPGLIKERE